MARRGAARRFAAGAAAVGLLLTLLSSGVCGEDWESSEPVSRFRCVRFCARGHIYTRRCRRVGGRKRAAPPSARWLRVPQGVPAHSHGPAVAGLRRCRALS